MGKLTDANHSGFSLVGVIVALAIVGFLAAAVVVFLQNETFFQKRISTKESYQEILNSVKLAMGKEIRTVLLAGNGKSLEKKSVRIGSDLVLRFTKDLKIPTGVGIQAPSDFMKKSAEECKKPIFSRSRTTFCMQIEKSNPSDSEGKKKGGNLFKNFEYAFVIFTALVEHSSGLTLTPNEFGKTGSATLAEIYVHIAWTYKTPEGVPRITHDEMSSFFLTPE